MIVSEGGDMDDSAVSRETAGAAAGSQYGPG